jgi:hypothetical protein
MLRIPQREPKTVALYATEPEKCRIYRLISKANVAYSANFAANEPGRSAPGDERTRRLDERTRLFDERTRRLGIEPELTACRRRAALADVNQDVAGGRSSIPSGPPADLVALRPCRAERTRRPA